MRNNVPDDQTPQASDDRARPSRRIVVMAGVVVLTVAAIGTGVLLRGAPHTDKGSPVPATATSVTPNADESYLRQICGNDVDLTAEAGLCVGRTSMSPSEIAKILDDLEQDTSTDSE